MDRRSLLGNIDHDDDEEKTNRQVNLTTPKLSAKMLFFCVLVVSLSCNIIWATTSLAKWTQSSTQHVSQYAELVRNREEPYVKETLYTSSNETLQAEMWHGIDIDAGMVALPDSWVSEHELRQAQRFPWDHSKGLYLLHGYHNLHCVKIIYNSLHEFRHSKSQTRNWHHVVHCLDGLRRQVICDADDTPRATERRAEVVTGLGQHRMCRSWEALESFAQKHTACYRRPEHPENGTPIIERFKHCPPDSQYVIDDRYVPVDKLSAGLPEESRLDS